MILANQPRIFDAEAFSIAMSRAMRAVVRLAVPGQATGRATGWVLTPQLVVTPEYAVHGENTERFVVQGVAGGRVSWEIEIDGPPEDLGPAAKEGFALVLLRLKTPKRLPRLDFGVSLPPAKSYVSLLSYAGGETRLLLSPGTIRQVAEPVLSHDADTQGGSGGAPIFDSEWRVIGMHMMANSAAGLNQGITLTAMIEMLQRSRGWAEIASFHRLANATGVRPGTEKQPTGTLTLPGLLRAALVTSFQKSRLSKTDRSLLSDKVVDPDESRWTLLPSERVKALRSGGGLERLREFAPANPRPAGDRAILRILSGPPFDLAELTEESLSWWIQVTDWFTGIVPDLPKPEQVSRELERRRVRSRLRALAGNDFEGRGEELAELAKWFQHTSPAPYSLTGIGGVGKSSLVSRFALSLPEDTLVLWLDFDRADLAPDNAVSVLTVLIKQTAIQLDGFTAPAPALSTWKKDAAAFGKALAARKLRHPPLLVLDSFEAAQYAERYAELWPVLDILSKNLPSLRVIVSGRAPVSNLKLGGRPAQSRHLTGLPKPDAAAWLQRHGIQSPALIQRIWELPPQGLPLNLHLAYHLMEAGGSARDFSRKLPGEIVTGFLYDRILNRVRERTLIPVAQAALVLRRLTVQIATEVLGAVVKLPAGDAAEWFGKLSRESSLMDGTTILTLRHEVRTSALQFLEQTQPKLVHTVDQRAADWYKAQKPDTPELAAELVYHRLRLGDLKGAAAAWRDGCGTYLQYAEENLQGAARKWLEDRKGTGSVSGSDIHVWEAEASERIRLSRSRDRQGAVSQGILAERKDRSSDSPLVFHEAYELRASGQPAKALAHLEAAGDGPYPEPIWRERAVLRALLCAEQGRKYEADVLLRLPEALDWGDRKQGQLERLLLFAGRLRVATDLDAERKVDDFLRKGKHAAFVQWISPLDLLRPALIEKAQRVIGEQVTSVQIPEWNESREHFARTIEKLRQRTVPGEPAELRRERERVNAGGQVKPGFLRRVLPTEMERVLDCAWRRWAIATQSPWLGRLANPPVGSRTQLLMASAALFVGFPRLKLETSSGPLERILEPLLSSLGMQSRHDLRSAALAFFLAAPHPLEVLVNRFAGKEKV
jgi:hypothetical protein